MPPASVLVVGAGPTGLALACELYRHGVPCRLVEASHMPGDRSKAIALWPRTLEIMADLGVADAAVARGLTLREATVYTGERPLAGFDLGALPTRYPFGLVLPQYETEALLTERLAALGGQVERGVTLVHARQSDDQVEAVLRHDDGTVENVSAGWLVGCDGPDSAVRRCADIAMPRRPEREGWVIVDAVMSTNAPPDRVRYFLERGRMLHMIPLPGGPDRWRLTLNTGPVQPDPETWQSNVLAWEVQMRAAIPARVLAVEWVSTCRVRQGLATTMRQGRLLLAGDAAHVHSPAGGQGINAGLQDAANLGWKLARVCLGRTDADLLDSYDRERRPASAALIRTTEWVTRLGTLANPAAIAVRDGLWAYAYRRGLMDRWAASVFAGLEQRYGRRPSARLRTRPATPGSRLPDLALDPFSPARLWDLLPPGRSALLVSHPACASALGRPDAVVVPPQVATALRLDPGTAIVVRPDRYIAVRCPVGHAAPIRDYFRNLGEDEASHTPVT